MIFSSLRFFNSIKLELAILKLDSAPLHTYEEAKMFGTARSEEDLNNEDVIERR